MYNIYAFSLGRFYEGRHSLGRWVLFLCPKIHPFIFALQGGCFVWRLICTLARLYAPKWSSLPPSENVFRLTEHSATKKKHHLTFDQVAFLKRGVIKNGMDIGLFNRRSAATSSLLRLILRLILLRSYRE